MQSTPRVLRDPLETWVGKKVTIGTVGNRYLSGVVRGLAGRTLEVDVRGEIVLVPAHTVSAIAEAPAALAEFIK